jgi:3-oxoacyl-[acyl-carrier protein] reductase
MDLGLEGRSALVVGSTSGIGLAIARALSREGAKVALSGRREDVAKEQAALLENAVAVPIDLTEPSSVATAVAQAEAALGAIDVLVLNSGGPPPGPAAELTAEAMDESLRSLLLAHVQLVTLVLPGMRERGWGRVLAVGSSGVQQPIANLARSNAARAALAGYLKTLAGEVGRDGVTVNMALPGRIDTDRVATLDEGAAKRRGSDAATVRRASEAAIPLGRYGTPEEFGDVAAFLCSERAAYVTGAQIRIDGGAIASL